MDQQDRCQRLCLGFDIRATPWGERGWGPSPIIC
jgi:hypothetical protein